MKPCFQLKYDDDVTMSHEYNKEYRGIFTLQQKIFNKDNIT